MRAEGLSVAEEIEWFVGIDWASQSHQVCLVDARGECLGERAVAHGGAGIEELCDWLIARTGATPEVIGVAIEMTQGPGRRSLVGTRFLRLWDQSQAARSVPRPLHRGRRQEPALAKAGDDRRDAHVLADSLRTDRHAFRRLSNDEPVIVQLRESISLQRRVSCEPEGDIDDLLDCVCIEPGSRHDTLDPNTVLRSRSQDAVEMAV